MQHNAQHEGRTGKILLFHRSPRRAVVVVAVVMRRSGPVRTADRAAVAVPGRRDLGLLDWPAHLARATRVAMASHCRAVVAAVQALREVRQYRRVEMVEAVRRAAFRDRLSRTRAVVAGAVPPRREQAALVAAVQAQRGTQTGPQGRLIQAVAVAALATLAVVVATEATVDLVLLSFGI